MARIIQFQDMNEDLLIALDSKGRLWRFLTEYDSKTGSWTLVEDPEELSLGKDFEDDDA